MAIINYTDQIKFAGKGYLDAKLMPVDTVDGLYAIPRTQRFEGLTITVLNGGKPEEYWLVGGTADANWVLKSSNDISSLDERINAEEEARIAADNEIKNYVVEVSDKVENNTSEIKTLTERVNALAGMTGTYKVDDLTIGVTKDDEKKLYVKILEKEGNILKQDINESNESGLYASIPIFFEDEELN